MWYKNYEKGKPFYTVSGWAGVGPIIHKHYFAGWVEVTRDDEGTHDLILELHGGTRRYSPTDTLRRYLPFPEEDLDDVIADIKESYIRRQDRKVKSAEKDLKEARDNLEKANEWEPILKDIYVDDSRPEYDYEDPDNIRFDDPMFTEVHIL